jgi:Tfp pilus assembly protein PilX
MRLSTKNGPGLSAARERLAAEQGFTMIVALGVLLLTSLFAAAAFSAVQADTPLTQRDLDAKRAYYAARAGANVFLYQLNQNPEYWQSCPTAGKTALAPSGTTSASSGTNESYSYKPVPANGATSCVASNAISTLIDEETQTFQVQFTGYSGTPGSTTDPEIQRNLIASFHKKTPLDYLWYTIYETLDPVTYPTPWPAGTNYNQCKAFKRPGPVPNAPGYDRDSDLCTDIVWADGDVLNGPSYTQDQYLITTSGSPSFGRAGTGDPIESSIPTTDPDDLDAICVNRQCRAAIFNGVKTPNAGVISPPNDNTGLATDAANFGLVYRGFTRIVLNGNTATVTNATTCPSGCVVSIGRASANREPIIYVNDQTTGCSSHGYSPYRVSYPPLNSACGDVYVSGSYSQSLTIASKGDIIINGNITRQSTSPVPTLGLVANNFVRVMHGITNRPADADKGECGPNNTEAPGQFLADLRIDAAIIAVQHSFIVDNYDCGQASVLKKLHITGAVAQNFRGTVGTSNGSTGAAVTGYLKDYNYDDRFAVAQPPYLFDIASSSWTISRETACFPSGPDPC